MIQHIHMCKRKAVTGFCGSWAGGFSSTSWPRNIELVKYLTFPAWQTLAVFVLVLQRQTFSCFLEINVALEKGTCQRAVSGFGIFLCRGDREAMPASSSLSCSKETEGTRISSRNKQSLACLPRLPVVLGAGAPIPCKCSNHPAAYDEPPNSCCALVTFGF